jgi:hypothetical protein
MLLQSAFSDGVFIYFLFIYLLYLALGGMCLAIYIYTRWEKEGRRDI